MALSITTEKDQEIKDMINMVRSAETCYFRKTKQFQDWYQHNLKEDNSAKIVAVKPKHVQIKYMRPNSNLKGWCLNVRNFNRALDVYLNNQYYYQQKYNSNLTTFTEKITSLEIWFSSIIEPPPKKPCIKTKKSKENFSKNNYLDALDEWFQREQCKYKHARSYYCPETFIQHLNKNKIREYQKVFIENYYKVKEHYKVEETWIEELFNDTS